MEKTTRKSLLTLVFEKLSFFFSEICQMRLDFDNFDITETTAGICTDTVALATFIVAVVYIRITPGRSI